MLTLATVAFMLITWLRLKKCNFSIRNLANLIPFAVVLLISMHLSFALSDTTSSLNSFKKIAVFCKVIDLTSKSWLQMTWFLVSYIAMVIWSINTSFTNFWCLSQLVTIGTLEAIQIRSTSMNNWHDFFLLNPDIFTFSTEESSFHTTYFG